MMMKVMMMVMIQMKMEIIDGRYDYLNLRMGHMTSVTQHQKCKK
jgi:hypothetical protein